MRSFIQRLALALGAWEACTVLCFLAVFISFPRHIWSKDLVLAFAQLAVYGLFIVGGVALLAPRLGKIGGAVIGFLCGLLPGVLLDLYVGVVGPRLHAFGIAAVARLLAVPSGLGGALAGIIFSRSKKVSYLHPRPD